jgi:hypothetical protein
MKYKIVKSKEVQFRFKQSKGKEYLYEIAIIIPLRKSRHSLKH